MENPYTVKLKKKKKSTNSHEILGKQGFFFHSTHFLVLAEGREKLVELL